MTDAPETAPGASAPARLRIDKWLWRARFFRSRGLAGGLAASGAVRVNGERIGKAAHAVRPGDVLTFPQGRLIRVVRILALGDRRGPATEAQALYDDLDLPVPRAALPATKAPEAASAQRAQGTGRPTKRARRAIDALRDRDP